MEKKVKLYKLERKNPNCDGCYFLRQATNREKSSCEKRRLRSEMADLREMFDFDGDYRCTLDFQQFIFVNEDGMKKHRDALKKKERRIERMVKNAKTRRIAEKKKTKNTK